MVLNGNTTMIDPFGRAITYLRVSVTDRSVTPAVSTRPCGGAGKGRREFHDMVMDLSYHRLYRGTLPVHLGPTEYRLLDFLMQHPRRVFSREELLDAVWGG